MSRRFPSGAAFALLALCVFAGSAAFAGGLLGPAQASSASSVTGTIEGPSDLGIHLKATYTVTASGGPAEAANGTFVGAYGFNATLGGTNTTGGFVTPTSGVLVNGTTKLTVQAPNVTQTLTLYVLVTSSYQGQNQSNNLTYTIDAVQPFVVNATLVVGSAASIGPLSLTVTLDGSPVGTVAVPTLTPNSTYPISFDYVAIGLSSGWHTFAISLAKEHGLITFPGGLQSFSTSFYVPGPPPDYTVWYFVGAAAFFGTIFIWTTRVAARRGGRAKK